MTPVIVSAGRSRFVHVTHVQNWLFRQQLVIVDPRLLFLRAVKTAHVFALLQVFFQPFRHVYLAERLTPAGFSRFLGLIHTLLQRIQVFQLQLKINGLFVPQRVDVAVYVHHVGVVEATKDVQNRVALADVAQELVAQSFAAGGPLHQAGNVHNLHRRR